MLPSPIRTAVKKLYRSIIAAKIPVPISVATLLGEERLVAVDIGGANGLLPHWVCLNGNANYILFEPHPESYQELVSQLPSSVGRGSYRVLPIGLSGTGGRRELFITNSPTGSSIMPRDESIERLYESSRYVYPMRTITIDTRTLQDALDDIQEKRVDMIKIDIQGAEYEVLTAMGDERLRNIMVAEIEIGLTRTVVGQKGIEEFNALLEANSMELLDVRVSRIYLAKNGDNCAYQRENFGVYPNAPGIAARAWEFDGIYFKRTKGLLESRDVGSMRRLMVAYCTYGFFLEAFRLSEKLGELGMVDHAESRRIGDAVVNWYRTQHGRILYKPSRIFTAIRQFLGRASFRGSPRWAQHMWVDYPSC